MEETYTPLFSEILDMVHKAKTKNQKVELLRKYKTDSLKMFLVAIKLCKAKTLPEDLSYYIMDFLFHGESFCPICKKIEEDMVKK